MGLFGGGKNSFWNKPLGTNTKKSISWMDVGNPLWAKEHHESALGITDNIGLTDSKAGQRAYDAQRKGADRAIDIQEKIYNEAKDRYAHYLDQGKSSFNDLVNFSNGVTSFKESKNQPFSGHSGVFSMSDFQKDPGYQFRMDEGARAVNNSAAANGSQMSGATMKALAKYGQNLASNEYQNAYSRFNQDYGNAYDRYNNDVNAKFNRLNALSNYGINASNAITGQGSSYGQNLANIYTGLGNAKAASEMNKNQGMKDLMSIGGQVMGGIAAFCWVARAVFGTETDKWKYARHYILNIGPEWFKKLYIKHGEKFSKKVEKSILLKMLLTPIFEYFVFRAEIDLSEREIYV